MSLKRLLVGSISLSDSQLEEENGDEPSDRPGLEMDSIQSTGEMMFWFCWSFPARSSHTHLSECVEPFLYKC